FALPDEKTRSNHFEIPIPKLASLILTHDSEGEIKGLNEFKNEHPPVAPLFFGFRIMVGVGMLMLLLAWAGVWQLIRRKTVNSLTLKAFLIMTFSGWIATLAGWYVTEIGRQPYLVSGILRTSDAVTTVPASSVTISLTLYLLVYTGLLIAYLHTLFLMARRAVEIEEISPQEQHNSTPNFPLHSSPMNFSSLLAKEPTS
ncbi:MAG: cytochrome ubiquinol oxidase subunit I, partial [Pseudomonadales bacterium]|nr:cytochrome ubiquinol oxidase subunit I [Pseudomonadales bacterium]